MIKRFLSAGFLAASVAFGGAAAASTIGVAVESLTSSTQVGLTENRPLLGGNAIKYFIPLSTSGTCVYGMGCGTRSDRGSGGRRMSMFLRFDPVSTLGPSTLNIYFEDLDLRGANDPLGFFESLRIFKADGDPLTGLINDIADAGVSGDYDTQQLLSFDLGVLPESVFYAEFRFKASYTDKHGNPKWGRNTPEYLIAEVISAVPLPAAGLLLLGALGGLGVVRRRRRS